MNSTKSFLIVVAASVALLSACTSHQGGAETHVPDTPRTPPTAGTGAPAPVTHSAQTPAATSDGLKGCVSADLGVTVDPVRGGSGMNKIELALTFTNRGAAACSLQGWPGVSFVTGDSGTQVGAAATREASGPDTAVSLEPGATATSSLTITNAAVFDPSTCAPVDVRGFRVYPPDNTSAKFVEHLGRACSTPEKSTIQVGPVRR